MDPTTDIMNTSPTVPGGSVRLVMGVDGLAMEAWQAPACVLLLVVVTVVVVDVVEVVVHTVRAPGDTVDPHCEDIEKLYPLYG